MFHGSITALITPFKDGEIDWPAFDDLIEWQIEQGIHGLVLCGTTGESPTLTNDEYKRIVERGVALVKKRIPVIAGTGSNATAKTIELTKHAYEAGADAALIVTPYYNKPTQEGLYAHYEAVAKAVDIPIIIYNIPGRCVVDMSVDTMARLAKLPNIVGVKDATSDLSRVKKTKAAISKPFCQLSGDDLTTLGFLQEGGDGCISVVSNIAPALAAELQQSWRDGNPAIAADIDRRLLPLSKALFVETSPAPVKYAASRLGLSTDEVRLPLVRASEKARAAVDETMENAGLLVSGKPAQARAIG